MRRYAIAVVPGLLWIGAALVIDVASSGTAPPSPSLPAAATRSLASNLERAAPHSWNVWRDVPARNADGTINAYVEISRGDSQKWEFDPGSNGRVVDRVMPPEVGGYPVNYGFVPQTVSYDGDPFDVLIVGPPIPGGTLVRGVSIGIFHMDDEKGTDSKVVIATARSERPPADTLSIAEQRLIAQYFRRYKQHEPGKFAIVRGWGDAASGLDFVRMTHAFFRECAAHAGSPCRVTLVQ